MHVSLCQVYVTETWAWGQTFLTLSHDPGPTFSTFCVKGNAELNNGVTWGAATSPETPLCTDTICAHESRLTKS